MEHQDELPGFDDLNEKDLTEESLQEELNKYRRAYQQEFEDKVKDDALENIEEYTREFFKKNITTAAAQIVFLSGNGETDSIKLRASKMVVDLALADAAADGDPIKQFLASLQKPALKARRTAAGPAELDFQTDN